MVRTTERLTGKAGVQRIAVIAVCIAAVLGLLGTAAGCSSATPTKAASSSEETDTPEGYGMGGVRQDIAISSATLNDKPAPWDLSTPESAVRSYLDWVSYAYRTSLSSEATATMSPYQAVRVDAYNQHNLQEEQLLDQTLESIAFGKASVGSTSTLLPAKEEWSYRYVSIKTAGKTLKGPYTAKYDTTYTLVKNESGDWVVDDIEVKALGEVK